jgi:hypothetical protein
MGPPGMSGVGGGPRGSGGGPRGGGSMGGPRGGGGLAGEGGAGPGMPGMQGPGGTGPAMPGMPGTPGAPGTQSGGGTAEEIEEEESSPFYVEGIVEVNHKDVKVNTLTRRIEFKHRWGKTSVYIPQGATITQDKFVDKIEHREITLIWYKTGTVAQRYDKELREVLLKKDATAEDWLGMAEWALQHGRYDDVAKMVERAAKLDPKNEKVVAFKKVDAAMSKELPKDDGADKLKEQLGGFKVAQTAHYTLLYDLQGSREADARLQRMESTYKGFFYWWAFRGKALRVPDRRLLAVLVDQPNAFEYQHANVYDKVPMDVDGFCARRENVAFYSNKRLDDAYKNLSQVTTGLWNSWNKDDLLNGQGWKQGQEAETAWAQTLTLLMKLQEEESAINSVSHEGTQQLLAATGLEGSSAPLLPRTVEAPQWVQFGVASFFETSRGAPWPGTGTPSWMYLTHFKTWSKLKKLDKPEVALKQVVTDHYFRNLEDARAKDSKDKQAEVRKAGLKARTMAWSLTYYLLQVADKREGLLRYYNELASLPRDMEFDEDVLMGIFARAFDLTDPGKPNEVNQARFVKLANDWYGYVNQVYPPTPEMLNRAVKDQSEMKSSGKKGSSSPK